MNGRTLVASAGWMTGSHLLAQAFAYGSLIFLARLLAPAEFGTVAVGTAVVYIAALAVSRGTYGAIIVHPRLTRAALRRAFRQCLLGAGVLAVVMALAAGPIVATFADGGSASAVAALAVCLPLHAVALIPTALLHKSMRFHRLAATTAIANIASATVAVSAGLAGLGVWSLVARQVVLFGALAVVSVALCWRDLRELPGTADPAGHGHARIGDRWFFVFGVTLVLSTNLDYLVIGGSADAGAVGLYALAFAIAMAPSTHLSDQVGKVLFAAAAAEPGSSRTQTVASVRLMSMLLLPLLPVGVVVAPVVLPAVLGPEWAPAVVAFQVLLVVGVGHAVVNCIGEALSGTGQMPFRAKVMIIRSVATLLALWMFVQADGIRGAALAQLAVFVPYAVVYATAGARRAGTTTRDLWLAVRPTVQAVAVQVAVTGAVLAALWTAGASEPLALCGAAAAGLAAAGPMVWRSVAGMRS